MASNYIGKISAVVTINPSEVRRGMDQAAKDVEAGGRKIDQQLRAAMTNAGKAFDSILTPLQKVSRQIQTALTFDNRLNRTDQQLKQIEQLTLAARQLATPLAQAAKQFDGMSLAVQGAFAPALFAAQRALEGARKASETAADGGEAAFRRVEAQVKRTTAAIDRMAEAQRIMQSAPTGRELAFAAPAANERLLASAAIRRQAANLPASAMQDGAVARQVQNLANVDQAIARTQARLEGLRISPQVDVRQIQEAERELQRYLEASRRIEESIRRRIALEAAATREFTLVPEARQQRGLGLFGRDAGTAEERAIQRARDADALFRSLPQAARDGLQGLAGIVGRVADGVQAGTSSAAQLNGVLDRLTARIEQAQAATREFTLVPAQTQPRGLGLFGTQVGTAEEQALQRARELDVVFRNLPQSAQDGLAGLARIAGDVANRVDQNRASAQQLEEILARLRTAMDALPPPPDPNAPFAGMSSPILTGPRGLQVSDLRGEIQSVESNLESLPRVIQAEFRPQIRAAENELIELSRSPEAFANNIRRVTAQVQELRANVARATQGFQFAQQFGSRSALELRIDQGQLRAVGAQIDFVTSRLSGLSAEARGPAVAALRRLAQVTQQAFRDGSIATDEGRRRIEEYTQRVVRLAAALTGANPRRFAEQLQRVGDIGRGAFGNAGLAAQQLAFAIDDFFSVTGDFSQRIRAIGNNLTQLGFILGGTQGLFLALGASIGAQAIGFLIKWANNGRTAEDQTKALNDALAKQKSLVEGVAQAYREIASAIQDAGLNDVQRRDAGIARQIEQLQREQREAREERVLGLDPGVARARAQVETRQRELQAASTVEGQAVAQLRLQQAQAEKQRAEDLARQLANQPIQSVANSATAGARDALAQAAARVTARAGEVAENFFVLFEEEAQRLEEAFQGAGSPEAVIQVLDDYIARLVESGSSDNELIRALQSLREQINNQARQIGADNAAAEVSERFLRIAAEMDAVGSRIADAMRGAASNLPTQLRQLNEQLLAAQKEVEKARKRGDEVEVRRAEQTVSSLEGQIASIDLSVRALQRFSDALDRATQEAQGNLTAAQNAADQARAADLLRGTPETADQRRRADEDLRRANEERTAVAQEVEAARQRFFDGNAQTEEQRAILRRMDQIDQQLQTVGVLAPGQAEELRRERAALEQQAVDMDPAVQRARDESTREEQRRQSALRGRELAMTPGQRAAEQLSGQLADIRQFFGRQAEQGSGLVDFRGQQEAMQQAAQQSFRSTAPAIFALADSVENAVLQGPSRAALEANDVSSVEGRRELDRLLRGDDAARNQNIVELRKQSEFLKQLVDAARQAGVTPIVDF